MGFAQDPDEPMAQQSKTPTASVTWLSPEPEIKDSEKEEPKEKEYQSLEEALLGE